MPRTLICLLYLFCSIASAETGLMKDNGFFVSLGGGMSPLYLEEIVANDSLAAGATVTAIHSSAQIGRVFNNYYSVQVFAEHNWYIDAAQNIYATGLAGLSGQYFLPDFYNTYLNAGAGLATKTVFGGDASAQGFGLHFGFGRPLNERLALNVGYDYLSLDSVATDPNAGEMEAISSVSISLAYLWY